MGLSTAERNKRKRERKKRAKEEERKRLELEKELAETETATEDVDVEIEYVAEPLSSFSETDIGIDIGRSSELKVENDADADADNGNGTGTGGEPQDNDIAAVLRRFHARASSALVSDDDEKETGKDGKDGKDADVETGADEDEDEDDIDSMLSNRKLREINRPTVAALKNRVERADLVEAHDVTSRDPDFLLFLKAVPSTVPVPRHWGRKRKYLQGKVRLEIVFFNLTGVGAFLYVIYHPSISIHPTLLISLSLFLPIHDINIARNRESTFPTTRLYCKNWNIRSTKRHRRRRRRNESQTKKSQPRRSKNGRFRRGLSHTARCIFQTPK